MGPKYEPFVDYLFGHLTNLEIEAAKYQADVKDCEENDEIRKLLLKFKSGQSVIFYNVFFSG